MRVISAFLIILCLFLQYKIWIAPKGILQTWQLRHSIEQQASTNSKLKAQNTVLEAEVKDLKEGHSAIEERARNELGMVKQDEVFYQIVK